ncbi:MAG: AAA family ATPase, partial [Thermoproteota archaeon]
MDEGSERKGSPYVILRVSEAISIDVGRGIARIDPEVAEKLKISAGDAIEIFGKRRTFALCWTAHPRDAGKGLIRIDGYIRENADVSIDDKVRVRKISAKYAQSVTLAPTEPLRIVGGEDYVKNILSGRIVAKGDSVPVRIMGRVVNLVVTAYRPIADAVIVNEDTVVKISEKVYSATSRVVPRITYEDIGGLRDAIQKV